MNLNSKFIFSSLLLLFLVALSMWWLIHSLPLNIKPEDTTKFIFSLLPPYMMLYMTLVIHLNTYFKNRSVDFSIVEIKNNGWELTLTLVVHNYSFKTVKIKRITSNYLKTKYFEENGWIVAGNTEEEKIIKLEVSDLFRKERLESLQQAKVIYLAINVIPTAYTQKHFQLTNLWGNTTNE